VESAIGTTLHLDPGTRPSLLRALHYLLLDWEADEFMQFMADLDRNEDGGLQIMYGIDGRRDLAESVREDGHRPVFSRTSSRAPPPPPRVAATSSAPDSPRLRPSTCFARATTLAAASSGGPVEDGAPVTCRLLRRSATRVAVQHASWHDHAKWMTTTHPRRLQAAGKLTWSRNLRAAPTTT